MQAFNDQPNPPPNKEKYAPRVLGVLVACEFSGIVRDAFQEQGHDAWSCDLLPAEHNSNLHIQGDVRDILNDGWDFLIVAHASCTRLCNSGVRWLHVPPADKTIDQMWPELREGAELFSDLRNAPIPRICVENPVMHSHAKKLIRNYTDFPKASIHTSTDLYRQARSALPSRARRAEDWFPASLPRPSPPTAAKWTSM